MRTHGRLHVELPTMNMKMKMRKIRSQEMRVSLIPNPPSFKTTQTPTSPIVRVTKTLETSMILLLPCLKMRKELRAVPRHLIRAEIIATVSALPRFSLLNNPIAKNVMLYIPVRG